jgi:hypothetical protein
MALSAFTDKSNPPQDDELAKVVGGAFGLWTELKGLITARFGPVTMTWGYASKSTGWGLRLTLDKPERTILYMTPCKGYFLASFALGERAVRAAQEAGLPDAVLAAIDDAKKYAEGRGVRLEVRTAEDVRSAEKIAIAKMAN